MSQSNRVGVSFTGDSLQCQSIDTIKELYRANDLHRMPSRKSEIIDILQDYRLQIPRHLESELLQGAYLITPDGHGYVINNYNDLINISNQNCRNKACEIVGYVNTDNRLYKEENIADYPCRAGSKYVINDNQTGVIPRSPLQKQQQYQALNQKIQTFRNIVTPFADQINRGSATINKLIQSVQSYGLGSNYLAELNSMRQTINNAINQYNTYNNYLKDFNQLLNDFNNAPYPQDTQIAPLIDNRIALELPRVQAFAQTIQPTTQRITAIENQINQQINQQIQYYQQETERLNKNVNLIETNYNNAMTDAKKINSIIAELRQLITTNDLTRTFSQLDSRFQINKTDINKQFDSIKPVTTNIQQLLLNYNNASFNQRQSIQVKLDDTINQIWPQITSLAQQISNYHSQLTDILPQVNQLIQKYQSQIKNFQPRIDTVKQNNQNNIANIKRIHANVQILIAQWEANQLNSSINQQLIQLDRQTSSQEPTVNQINLDIPTTQKRLNDFLKSSTQLIETSQPQANTIDAELGQEEKLVQQVANQLSQIDQQISAIDHQIVKILNQRQTDQRLRSELNQWIINTLTQFDSNSLSLRDHIDRFNDNNKILSQFLQTDEKEGHKWDPSFNQRLATLRDTTRPEIDRVYKVIQQKDQLKGQFMEQVNRPNQEAIPQFQAIQAKLSPLLQDLKQSADTIAKSNDQLNQISDEINTLIKQRNQENDRRNKDQISIADSINRFQLAYQQLNPDLTQLQEKIKNPPNPIPSELRGWYQSETQLMLANLARIATELDSLKTVPSQIQQLYNDQASLPLEQGDVIREQAITLYNIKTRQLNQLRERLQEEDYHWNNLILRIPAELEGRRAPPQRGWVGSITEAVIPYLSPLVSPYQEESEENEASDGRMSRMWPRGHKNLIRRHQRWALLSG
jgi:chromosome segregation ATPase